MTGYEQIKEKRISHGWSLKQFADMADISQTSLKYYELGENRLETIPVYKIKNMFGLLGLSVVDFFDEYYDYKEEMDKRIADWKKDNPVDYNYLNVKKRLKSRISQNKRRGNFDAGEFEEISRLYRDFLEVNNLKYKAIDYMTEKDYAEYVMPIYYQMALVMDDMPDNNPGRVIIDCFHKTEYSLTDVANICGLTRQHLNQYVNGKLDFYQMRTDTALKICYLLKADFNSAFKIV